MKLKQKINDFRLNLRYAFRPRKPWLTLRLAKAVIKARCLGKVSLRYVDFAIGFRCNFACRHCFAVALKQNDRRVMQPIDYQRTAEQCMQLGAVNFSFQGGEPLILKNLHKIISVCSPHKNLISVSTNGYLLSRDCIRDLKQTGVDILTVSLDSSIATEHDRFRGKKGAFSRALSGIEIALEEGLHVTLGTVVTHQNLKTPGISGLLSMAKKMKMLIYLILPVPAGRWSHSSDMMLTDQDLAYVEQLTQTSPYIRTDLQANLGLYGCGAAKEILYISPYGDVLPCPFMHISPGNIFKNPVKQIRDNALTHPSFASYASKCLVSTDRDFIDTYLAKTFQHSPLPLAWEEVFPNQRCPS